MGGSCGLSPSTTFAVLFSSISDECSYHKVLTLQIWGSNHEIDFGQAIVAYDKT